MTHCICKSCILTINPQLLLNIVKDYFIKCKSQLALPPQVPGTFTSSMRDYTDNMCWIKNTYYVPLEERIPNKDEDIHSEINYYQWVPIVLILQALMFYLPYMVSGDKSEITSASVMPRCGVVFVLSLTALVFREAFVG